MLCSARGASIVKLGRILAVSVSLRPGYVLIYKIARESGRTAKHSSLIRRFMPSSRPFEEASMTKKPKDNAQKAKVEAELDEALAETFPASDPPAMSEPASGPRPTRKAPKQRPKGK